MLKMLCQQKLVPKIINKERKYHIIGNVDHYRKSGSSNLLIAGVYFRVQIKMIKLVEAVKFLFPYRKNWVI